MSDESAKKPDSAKVAARQDATRHDPGRRFNAPKALGLATSRLTNPVLKKRGAALVDILGHWTAIVGPLLAAETQPERLIYADATGLVRRVDYTPLHYGPWMRAAQCLDGHESFGGFIYPTRRVVYPCLVGGHLARLTPLSWLTLDDISVIRGQAA